MAEQLHNDTDVLAVLQQHDAEAMTEVVQANVAQLRPVEQPVERAVHVARLQRSAGGTGEYKRGRQRAEPGRFLAFSVSAYGFDREAGQGSRQRAVLGLCLLI